MSKMSRQANEGLICVNKSEKQTDTEINCETDFVAKNEDFLIFAERLVKLIMRFHQI